MPKRNANQPKQQSLTVQQKDVQFPPVSQKDYPECTVLLEDQILLIDVSYH